MLLQSLRRQHLSWRIFFARRAVALAFVLQLFSPRPTFDFSCPLPFAPPYLFAEANGASSAASATAATPYYQSITALDKYGNSPQIRNALLASSRHGALVVSALSAKDGAVVICSLRRPRTGVRRPSRRAVGGGGGVPRSRGHAVNVVATGDEGFDGAATTAVVCSGVKSDATLLISLLRSHSRRVWDRYDIVPGVDRVADATSEAFLTFMGYDRSKEVMDGVGPVCEEEGGDEEFGMSRPFGVQALIVGVGPSGEGGSHAAIRSVDPSGVTGSWVAHAMGRGSDEANKLLSKKWRRDLSEEETIEMCVEIVREVINKDIVGDSKFDFDNAEVMCETLTPAGLKLRSVPFLTHEQST